MFSLVARAFSLLGLHLRAAACGAEVVEGAAPPTEQRSSGEPVTDCARALRRTTAVLKLVALLIKSMRLFIFIIPVI